MADQRKCRRCDTPANRPVFLRKKKSVKGRDIVEDTPMNEFQCNCGRSVFSGTLTAKHGEPKFVDHIED